MYHDARFGEFKTGKQLFEASSAWQLRKQVFWDIATCGWLITYRKFEETNHLYRQGCKKSRKPEEDCGTYRPHDGKRVPPTRRNNPEELFAFYIGKQLNNQIFKSWVITDG
jgi:hypothetical protein